MLKLVVTHLVCSLVPPGPGLSPAELILLLEIGVGEREIALYAERSGGFQTIDGETFARAEELGASEELLAILPRAAPDYGTLSEIASTSEVHRDDRLGVSFVYPAGWTVATVLQEDGAAILRISPRTTALPRVFSSPAIFLFLVEDSRLVPEASDPVRDRLGQLVARRLRKSGLRPTRGLAGVVTLLGAESETVAIEAAVDGPAPGVLELAFAVNAQGRAVAAGFTAPAADRARVRKDFARLARSVVLH